MTLPELLDEVYDKRQAYNTELETINTRATEELRPLTEPERQQADDLLGKIKVIDERIATHVEHAEASRKAEALMDRRGASTSTSASRPSRRTEVEETSPGQAFVESPAFLEYRNAPSGRSGVFEIADFIETRATITTAQLAIPHYTWVPLEYRTTAPLLELMNLVRVSSGVVDWVEIGGDPLAAVVAEGAAKPEATVTATAKTTSLDTIAHWVQITRQALDDASYIRSLLEGKLRRGLLNKLETDAATLLGASTAIQTATDATSLTNAIRVGIGKVESAGYRPNAIALNPADYAALDIAAATSSMNGPVRRSEFWGLTTVAAASIAAGFAYVGDFTAGMTYFDRGVTSVFLSDSHADLFIKNVLVILAETRGKAAITDPLALCECSKTP